MCARAGYDVRMLDSNAMHAKESLDKIAANMEREAKRGQIEAVDKAEAMARHNIWHELC